MTDEQIFDQVIQLPVGERAAFLASECKDQPELRTRIEALIAAHEQADSLLDTEAMVSGGDTIVERPIHKTVGDFEIIRELGRGGMGVVFEARQKSLKRRVALKVLSSGLGLSSKAILRFRREAEAAGKLHHTNIVPIYTTGEDKGIHYYAMELVDGPSLDAVIKDLKQEATEKSDTSESDADVPNWLRKTALYDATGPAPARTDTLSVTSSSTVAQGSRYFDHVATIIAEVADALDYAHEHGVIHRDIKPSNLLLAPDGRLSINDFGLARMLEQPGMTMSGEFVGSPLYMSPEQITAGRVTIDHRTDIYSLGATLYELLVLQPPFPGKTRDQVLGQILQKDAVAPRKLHRKVPIDLDTICMKAIDKDPDRRYQTAGQLANDLRKFVSRHAISARRIGPAGQMAKLMRRNPVATAFAAFVLLVVIGSSWWHHQVKREFALAQQQYAIEDLGRKLLDDLFRGQTDDAESLISQAAALGASSEWLSFHRGIKELFRQDYEESKQHFEKVRGSDQYAVKATALLAIANMWSGNEYLHFSLLSEIDPAQAQSFEDKFFLGYAHTWGNSKLSLQLLKDASEEREGLVFVRFLRGVAAREVASFAFLKASEKKMYIDDAVEDIEWATNELRTPLALKEQTIAHLHLAKIYEMLVDSDPENADSYKATAESAKTRALNLLDELRANENHSDAQYALVMLLAELNPEMLRKVADCWQSEEVIVSSYSAHFLALHFAAMKDYEAANQWRKKAGRNDGINIDTLVKFVDPNRQQSIFQLRQELRKRVDKRIADGDSENLGFDVMSLAIMGDKSYLQHYNEDRIEILIDQIWGADCTKLISDYLDPANKMTADELIAKCENAPAANAALMHANFCLGAEAIAEKRWADAKRYFEDCRRGGQFMFTVYFLSDLILQHHDDWGTWAAEWENETD